MATKDSLMQDQDEFAAAHGEEIPAAPEQSEDEAFGLNMPEESQEIVDDNSGTGDAPTIAVDASPVGEEVAAEGGEVIAPGEAPPEEAGEAVEAPAEEVGETPAEEGAEGEMPAMTHNEQSWEGRLRKREAELKAREEALNEAPSVEGEAMGDISAVEASLAEDFGEDFVKSIKAIAKASAEQCAGEKVDGLHSNLAEVIADIKNSRAKRHFEDIFDAHPDFETISEGQEFRDWVSGQTGDEQAHTSRVIDSGSAREINQMLARYKAVLAQADAPGTENGGAHPSDLEVDDAEGVRSSGLRLPNAPVAASDDYEKAWAES